MNIFEKRKSKNNLYFSLKNSLTLSFIFTVKDCKTKTKPCTVNSLIIFLSIKSLIHVS